MTRRFAAVALATFTLAAQALADEAVIRKNLSSRYPDVTIDEVNKTPIPGLFELRLGSEVIYSDAEGNYLVQGNIIDTKSRKNLTEERVNKLSAIAFESLPLADAIVWKNGKGTRKLAVFADPNCGYCKKFERDLTNVKDVTVYTFLIPILGGDSPQKAQAIWCSKDRTAAWRSWMIEGTQPPKLLGQCESPVARNMAFAQKYRINGTPALVFEDGTRVPGALPAADVEKQLAAAAAKK
jgi:thiol:disulfide interchange protein DsbC